MEELIGKFYEPQKTMSHLTSTYRSTSVWACQKYDECKATAITIYI
jgi:hypothetical protein